MSNLLDTATMDEIKSAVEGQKFTHFVNKEDGTIYDETQPITGNLTVIAVYEPIPENTNPVEPNPEESDVPSGDETDEEPKTGEPSKVAAYAIGLLSLIGVVATKKFLK